MDKYSCWSRSIFFRWYHQQRSSQHWRLYYHLGIWRNSFKFLCLRFRWIYLWDWIIWRHLFPSGWHHHGWLACLRRRLLQKRRQLFATQIYGSRLGVQLPVLDFQDWVLPYFHLQCYSHHLRHQLTDRHHPFCCTCRQPLHRTLCGTINSPDFGT